MDFSVNWKENALLEQILKKYIITTENAGITSETEAKPSQYILAVGRGRQQGEKIHIQTPGNRIISPHPASALFPRRQDEEQNT